MGTLLGIAAFLLIAGSAAIWFRAARQVALPENRIAFVTTWAGSAVLGLVALLLGPGWLGGVPATLALLTGTFLTVLVAISRQRVASDAVVVGESLRAFTAPDDSGQIFDSASLAGKPTLLKFFRGHW